MLLAERWILVLGAILPPLILRVLGVTTARIASVSVLVIHEVSLLRHWLLLLHLSVVM